MYDGLEKEFFFTIFSTIVELIVNKLELFSRKIKNKHFNGNY